MGEKTTAQYLYLGVQRGSDNKLLHTLEPLIDGARTGKETLFCDATKTALRSFIPGFVYEIESEPTEGDRRTYILSGAKRVAAWDDAGECAAIRLASDAARSALALDKRLDKEGDDFKKLATALAPIRAKYHKTISTTERTAIELLVLRALRTYKV